MFATTLRWLVARVATVVIAAALARRALSAIRRRASSLAPAGPHVLPSLYDVHPDATKAPRRRVGVRTIPLEKIVGTLRHPSQNTADFLPLPGLRGMNWQSRWQRLTRAMDRLQMLPPIDVVQVGDEYWVEDGHNRVAAALRAGAVDIDADTTQLLLPGVTPAERGWIDSTAIVGGEELRQAGAGRHSRTSEQRTDADALSRDDLLRNDEGSA